VTWSRARKMMSSVVDAHISSTTEQRRSGVHSRSLNRTFQPPEGTHLSRLRLCRGLCGMAGFSIINDLPALSKKVQSCSVCFARKERRKTPFISYLFSAPALSPLGRQIGRRRSFLLRRRLYAWHAMRQRN
jgi:hypothetical protein